MSLSMQPKNPPLYPVSHSSNVCRQSPDDWFVCLDNPPICGSVCPWMAKSFMPFDICIQQVWVLFSMVVQATNLKKAVRVENGDRLKPQRWQWVCLNDLWWVCKPHYCLCSRSTPYFLSYSLKLLSAHRNWCPCSTATNLGASGLCQVSFKHMEPHFNSR